MNNEKELFNQASEAIASGMLSKAMGLLLRLLDEGFDFAILESQLAEALIKRGEYSELIRLCRSLYLAKKPDCPACVWTWWLWALTGQRSFSRARELKAFALAEQPYDAAVLLESARFEANYGSQDDAAKLLLLALANGPSVQSMIAPDAGLVQLLGWVREELGLPLMPES